MTPKFEINTRVRLIKSKHEFTVGSFFFSTHSGFWYYDKDVSTVANEKELEEVKEKK